MLCLVLIDQAKHNNYGHGPPKTDCDNIKQVEGQSIKTDTTIPYQLVKSIDLPSNNYIIAEMHACDTVA